MPGRGLGVLGAGAGLAPAGSVVVWVDFTPVSLSEAELLELLWVLAVFEADALPEAVLLLTFESDTVSVSVSLWAITTFPTTFVSPSAVFSSLIFSAVFIKSTFGETCWGAKLAAQPAKAEGWTSILSSSTPTSLRLESSLKAYCWMEATELGRNTPSSPLALAKEKGSMSVTLLLT